MSATWEPVQEPVDQEILDLVHSAAVGHKWDEHSWIDRIQNELRSEGFRLVNPRYVFQRGKKSYSDGIHWDGIESIGAE